MSLTFKSFLLLESTAPDRAKDLTYAVVKQLEISALDTKPKSLHKKMNGTVRHIRLCSSDIDSVFGPLGITLKYLPGDKRATGKVSYKTYIAKLGKEIGEFKKGEEFFVVNTFVEGSKLKPKDLTPARLGLETEEGKFLKITKAKSLVKKGLSDLDIFTTEELTYLESLINLPSKDTNKLVAPSSFSSEDLNRIAIDFGEIFGAFWLAKKSKFDEVNFPSGNNVLLDFCITDGEEQRYVSSKAGSGAPASLGVAVDQMNKDEKFFTKKYGKEFVEVLNLLQNSTAIEGGMLANKTLNTPGYKALVKAMGTEDVSRKSVETYLSKFKTPKELMSALEEFFTVIERKPTMRILEQIFELGTQRVGIVSAQMSNYLVALFNNEAKYKKFGEMLNDSLRRIDVEQLYTDLTSEDVTFTLKHFEEGTFKWLNNSSTMKANLSKIGFKMDK